MSVQEVLDNKRRWHVEASDAIATDAWEKYACRAAPDRDAPGDAQTRQLWRELCAARRQILDLEAENRRLREEPDDASR
jgi:hypothetical protein